MVSTFDFLVTSYSFEIANLPSSRLFETLSRQILPGANSILNKILSTRLESLDRQISGKNRQIYPSLKCFFRRFSIYSNGTEQSERGIRKLRGTQISILTKDEGTPRFLVQSQAVKIPLLMMEARKLV